MKFVLKIVCLCILLNSCSGSVKNETAAESESQLNNLSTCDTATTQSILLDDSILELPRIKFSDKKIEEKINSYFTIEKITGYTLSEVKQQQEKFKKDTLPYGLTDLSYSINYNKNCLLSLTIFVGTCGAYPSSYSSYYNFDLKTGDSLTYEKLLNPKKTNELVQYCDSILQERIAATKRQDNCDDEVAIQLDGQKFIKESLANFYITENDFVFVYFYGFPHALKAAEPDGEIKISRIEMKKYLKENEK